MVLLAHFRAQVSTAPRTPPRRVARLPFPEALKTYFVDPQLILNVSQAYTGFCLRRRTPLGRPSPSAGSGAISASSFPRFMTIISFETRWRPSLCFPIAILAVSRPHEPRWRTRGELICLMRSTPWLMCPRAGTTTERPIADRASALTSRARDAASDAHAGWTIAIHWRGA